MNLGFPFNLTAKHMDKAKTLILIRGLPGSGKTSFAELLSEGGKYPVFSVDSYFTNKDTGEYLFNYKENHLAYKECENNTKQAMQSSVEKIFIDHTFTLDWEIEPYFKLASSYGYLVFAFTLENRHNGENVHGLTDEQLLKMAKSYKLELLPERLREKK
ncbi:ATPase AAA [Leptospira kobayashii]|uniref:ATPase AAA n=2 Tax=Leptospira kobayashii TaxID=1917830 RepID=A0ABN6KK75_9LEPT|nr:ATPase AAA [Leptospira kobayashii]